jgi:hypothetical protein
LFGWYCVAAETRNHLGLTPGLRNLHFRRRITIPSKPSAPSKYLQF